MKALILNSGSGSRMEDLTKNNPKCLVPIHGKSILSRQLELLLEQGIHQVIITTGPFEEQIQKHVSTYFPSLSVTYVQNRKYQSTNYIYSIFLARKALDDDILLLHGDLVFEINALKAVLESKNGVIINDKADVPIKDFKGKIVNGLVTEIGVNVFGTNCFMLQPLYLLRRDKLDLLLLEIERFVNRGEVKCYAENAFNTISSQIGLKPVYFHGFCMEIDTKTDLAIAEDLLAQITVTKNISYP